MPACARCREPAAALLSYAYAARQAWLGDLPAAGMHGAIALCHRHADCITPPVGWVLHDRRTPLRTLFDAGVG